MIELPPNRNLRCKKWHPYIPLFNRLSQLLVFTWCTYFCLSIDQLPSKHETRNTTNYLQLQFLGVYFLNTVCHVMWPQQATRSFLTSSDWSVPATCRVSSTHAHIQVSKYITSVYTANWKTAKSGRPTWRGKSEARGFVVNGAHSRTASAYRKILHCMRVWKRVCTCLGYPAFTRYGLAKAPKARLKLNAMFSIVPRNEAGSITRSSSHTRYLAIHTTLQWESFKRSRSQVGLSFMR